MIKLTPSDGGTCIESDYYILFHFMYDIPLLTGVAKKSFVVTVINCMDHLFWPGSGKLYSLCTP